MTAKNFSYRRSMMGCLKIKVNLEVDSLRDQYPKDCPKEIVVCAESDRAAINLLEEQWQSPKVTGKFAAKKRTSKDQNSNIIDSFWDNDSENNAVSYLNCEGDDFECKENSAHICSATDRNGVTVTFFPSTATKF